MATFTSKEGRNDDTYRSPQPAARSPQPAARSPQPAARSPQGITPSRTRGNLGRETSFFFFAMMILISVTAVLTSCGGTSMDSGTAPPDGITQPSAALSQSTEPDRLAQALAMSLGTIEGRRLVRDALRSSNLTEHKVDLRTFITAADQSGLLVKAASHLATQPEMLLSQLDRLAPIDLYLVAKQHRTTWTPDAPLIVAAQMGDHPPDHAFDATGQTVDLHLQDHVLPATALLYLERAETKQEFRLTRIAGSGFIQDPQEQRIDVGRQQCDPEINPGCEGGGGEGGGGSPLCSAYKLKSLATAGLVDNNNPFEGNEIEVRGTASHSSGTARITEVPSTSSFNLDADILCTSDSPNQIVYYVVETDGFLNPDDYFTLPFPNGSKHFSISLQDYGYPIQLFSWPSELDSSVYDWKVSIKVNL